MSARSTTRHPVHRKRSKKITANSHPAKRKRKKGVYQAPVFGLLGFALLAMLGVVALLLIPGGRGVVGLSSDKDAALTAIIVDQLELTVPNPEFVADTTQLLERDGYTVEYVAGSDVTVDFYRSLPKRDYDLVILRVHSTADVSRGDEGVTSVSLFTGEEYSETAYYEEQLGGAVGFAQYTADSPKLFGITADFVRDSMEGRFDGTTVLMMGCQGFINAEGAAAFTDKGARTFIGWDGLVSADHTDEATAILLRHLIEDGAAGRDAVDLTMAEIGPDPDFGSQLVARP